MAAYATAADLEAYLAGSTAESERPLGPARIERLLEDAQRDVDRAIGGVADPVTGLRVDVASLTAAQRGALARATCAAAEHRIEIADEIPGGTEFGPPGVPLLWRGSRPPGPRVFEELAGFALVRRSGTLAVLPDASA